MRFFRALVPALDVSLVLGVDRCTAYMAHVFVSRIFRQFASEIVGAIVDHIECKTSPLAATEPS